MKPLISINIVSFNGEKYIKKGLDSVFIQSYRPLELNILDNNSHDRTRKIIESILKSKPLAPFTFIQAKENFGYAKGNNILIRKSKGEYVVLLNQDACLEKNYVKYAVQIFNSDDAIAALQPKILRFNFDTDTVVKKDGLPIIDATGLVMLKNRRIIARGQGQKDQGQFQNLQEIFGADGAAPIFRRSALEDIGLPTFPPSHKASAGLRFSKDSALPRQENLREYFDEDFFMYKEDVDLSWRARLYGWKIMYSPRMIAYHARGSGESVSRSYLEIVNERRHISTLAKALSWRNQRLMQVKNELPLLFLRDFPTIILKEIASLCYILLFERFAFQSIKEFFRLLPKAFKKRKLIMRNRRASYQDSAIWFS